MALMRSHIMSDISGSIGGITYTRNRYASMVGRVRVKPVDPQNCSMEAARQRFNTSVFSWKSLDQLERDAWELYAKDTPWINALGQDIRLTGQAMYIAQVSAGTSILGDVIRSDYDAAPCTPGLFPVPLLTVGCCPNPVIGVTVAVQNQDSTNNMNCVVRISPPQSPSVNYYNGPWVKSQEIVLLGISAGASDDAAFCPLCEAKYFFEVRGLDGTNGNNMSTLTHCEGVACTDPI